MHSATMKMPHITLKSRTNSAYGEYNTLHNYQQKTVRTEYVSNIYLWLVVTALLAHQLWTLN